VGEDSNESGVCPEGAATGSPEGGGVMSNVIRIDEERIKGHLDRIVRASVEETLNALLDAEADRLVGADRYERNEARRITAQATMSASCTPGLAR
jgi:putative transposase